MGIDFSIVNFALNVIFVPVMDERDGKRFGFVRFGDMSDQREALIHMNGFHGFEGNPIKVSMAIPKPCLSEASKLAEQQSAQYSYMYENYQTDRGAWGNYGVFQGPSQKLGAAANPLDLMVSDDEEDDSRLVEHDAPINVDAMNAEFIQRSQDVWDNVERDRWIYNLENDEGIVPNFRKNKPKIAAVLNNETE